MTTHCRKGARLCALLLAASLVIAVIIIFVMIPLLSKSISE